jgi:hypothetical protein
MHITGEASGGGRAERVLIHLERVALYFRCSAHLTLVYRWGRRVYPRRSLRHSITVLKKSIGDAVRELEERILIHSQSVHAEAGSHAKLIRTWDRWARNAGFKDREMPPQQAGEQFEDIVERLNVEFKANARLPWR